MRFFEAIAVEADVLGRLYTGALHCTSYLMGLMEYA